ncbi:MAG: hypothetical protein ACXV9R_05595 [Methylobacter sp.]
MGSLTINNINHSSFQQLSSSLAKTNASQAAQQAQALRKQADAAQAQADQYQEKAQSLDNQANKEQVKSDVLKANLNMSNAFDQAANQTSNIIAHAIVKTVTYSPQGTSSTTSNANTQVIGTHINTVV